MQPTEVDLKVIQGIRNAVAARGEDWVYPKDGGPDWVTDSGTCYNLLPNGEPACIIGFIAVDQGLPTERETSANSDADDWGVSGPVRTAMVEAQGTQDEGYPWGVAMERFFGILEDEGMEVPE